MIKQINKIALLFLVLFIISCRTSKEARKQLHQDYIKYLASRNIDLIKANDLDYFDDYLAFEEEQKKQALINSAYLKVNKVYAYQRSKELFTFCVYTEEGDVYCADYEFTENKAPINDSITLTIKPPLELRLIGVFELDKDAISINRFITTAYRKWKEVDKGAIRNDTITLKTSYISKKYGYKKKFLAKIRKTNFEFIYQPNLEIFKFNDGRFDWVFVKGSFNIGVKD